MAAALHPARKLCGIYAILTAPGAAARLIHAGRVDDCLQARWASPQAILGSLSASAPHRDSVSARTPISRDTTSSGALSGGSKRATAGLEGR